MANKKKKKKKKQCRHDVKRLSKTKQRRKQDVIELLIYHSLSCWATLFAS